MCITNPLKISDFQGNLLHMLLFSPKHAFYFSILRIKEGLSHVQQPLFVIDGEYSAVSCEKLQIVNLKIGENATLQTARDLLS